MEMSCYCVEAIHGYAHGHAYGHAHAGHKPARARARTARCKTPGAHQPQPRHGGRDPGRRRGREEGME